MAAAAAASSASAAQREGGEVVRWSLWVLSATTTAGAATLPTLSAWLNRVGIAGVAGPSEEAQQPDDTVLVQIPVVLLRHRRGDCACQSRRRRAP